MPDIDPDRITTLTFDCYGTLIDWEAGTIEALRPLLAHYGVRLSDDEIITLCQDLEEPLCEPPFRPYSDVLAGVMDGFGQHFGFPVSAAERSRLAASVPSWQPFPDTVEALRALGRQYRLAIISNIDDDLFAASARQLGVSFGAVITAEQARCYKPHPPIFEEALRRLGAEPGSVAHIAEGATEIGPMRQLGCRTVWVRRNGRSARLLTQAPDLEVPDLHSLTQQLLRRGPEVVRR
jgi:2-haloacid dehalogenase